MKQTQNKFFQALQHLIKTTLLLFFFIIGFVSVYASYNWTGDEKITANKLNQTSFWTSTGTEPGNNNIYRQNGNVGIGTSNPQVKLHISNAEDSMQVISTGKNGGYSDLQLLTPNGGWQMVSANNKLSIYQNGVGNRMIIDDKGNMGIGMINPDMSLEVGNISLHGGVAVGGSLNGNRWAYLFVDPSGDKSVIWDDQTDMRFGVESTKGGAYTERMRIMANGNVGIGTDNPTEKLEVNGNVYLNNGLSGENAQGSKLVFNNTFNTVGPNKILLYDSSSWAGGLGLKSDTVTFYSGGKFQFYTGSTNVSDGNARVTILSDGNFGIGTSNPSAKLEVAGNIKANDVCTTGGKCLSSAGDNSGSTVIQDGIWQKNETDSTKIYYNNGNVGIGTNSPGEKLEVVGKIKAEGMEVNGNIKANNIKSISAFEGDQNLRQSDSPIFSGMNVKGGTTVKDLLLDGGNLVIKKPGQLHLESGEIRKVQTLSIDGDNVPASTNAYDLGSNTQKWKDIYASGMVNAGTISATTINVDNLNTKNIKTSENIEAKYFIGDGSKLTGIDKDEKDPKVQSKTANSIAKSNGNQLVDSGIYENDGKVGVGTNTPKMSLEASSKPFYNGSSIGVSDGLSKWAYLFTSEEYGNSIVWDNNTAMRFGTETDKGAGGYKEHMRIAQTGNVGIGTSDPKGKLHISNTDDSMQVISTSKDGGYADLQLSTPNGGWQMVSYNNKFDIQQNGQGSKMTISENGNIGIGTTTPGHKLDIEGGSIILNNNGSAFGVSSNDQGIHLYSNNSYDRSKPNALWDRAISFKGSNVGIDRDPNTNYKLDVNGKLNATEVCINNNCKNAWPSGGSEEQNKSTDTSIKEVISPSYVTGAVSLSCDGVGKIINAGVEFKDVQNVDAYSTFSDVEINYKNNTAISNCNDSNCKLHVICSAATGAVGGESKEVINNTTVQDGIWQKNETDSTKIFYNTGNVGIGTTSPENNLDVANVKDTKGISISGSEPNVSFTLSNKGTGGSKWTISSTGAGHGMGNGKLIFDNGFGSGKVTFTPDGKVGIGTTSPKHKLSVQGSLGISTEGTEGSEALTASIHTTTNSNDYTDPRLNSYNAPIVSHVGILANNERPVANTWSGYDIAGTTFYEGAAHGFTGARIAAQYPNIDKGYTDTNLLFLAQEKGANAGALVERMRIDTNGNVGIGTNDPSLGNKVGSKFTILSDNTGLVIGRNNGVPAFAINPQHDSSWIMYDYFGNGWHSGLVQKDGKVGIGTTDPKATLDINGNISIRNANPIPITSDRNGDNNGGSISFPNGPINIRNTYASDAYQGPGLAIDIPSPGAFEVVKQGGGPIFVVKHDGTFHFGGAKTMEDSDFFISGGSDSVWGLFKNDAKANTRKMMINSSGNVGFETHVAIGMMESGEDFLLNVNGNSLGNSWEIRSDQRLKQNIQPIKSALEKVQNLNGVTFEWKKDGKKDIGFIAQDVGKVLPELVHTDSSKEQMKSLEYGNITAVLVEAMKEQQKQIESQQKEIEMLKKEIASSCKL